MLPVQGAMQFSDHSVLYDLLIPKDHLLRKINDLIDFNFVYKKLKDKYVLIMVVQHTMMNLECLSNNYEYWYKKTLIYLFGT